MAMHTWFECKIRYEKLMENGMNKKVTEPYLVDALSFTEAEARIIEEMTPFITGEFTVSDIKRANYSELFPSEEESADRWFKCKLIFITLDEKSGAEKKTSTQVLVQAADLRDAVKKLDEGEGQHDQEQQHAGHEHHDGENPSQIGSEGNVAEAQGGHDRQRPVHAGHPGEAAVLVLHDVVKQNAVEGDKAQQHGEKAQQKTHVAAHAVLLHEQGDLGRKEFHGDSRGRVKVKDT